MDFRAVCTTQAFSALGGGAFLLVLPGPLLSLFGLGTESGTQLVARMLGGVLFALGATLFGVRDLEPRDQRIRVTVGNAVCDGLITGWIALDVARGALPMLALVLVALFAINCASWLITLRK